MKEIKLKFLPKRPVPLPHSGQGSPASESPIIEPSAKSFHCVFTLENGAEVRGFTLFKDKLAKSYELIGRPEPHITVLYFASAQAYLKQLESNKVIVLAGDNNIHKMLEDVCNYFIAATSFSTFLFNSLESFVNKTIPEGYEHKQVLSEKTEVFNKAQIQRHKSFEYKIKTIVPEITGKYFHKEYGHLYDKILKLKECRDSVVHAKDFDYASPYGYLFNIIFNLDNQGVIDAAMTYINYYEPGLIEFK